MNVHCGLSQMNLIKLAVVTLALPNLYGGHLGGLIYKTKIKSFP